MLSINHLEDYLSKKNGTQISISFDTLGQRRLNHSVKLPLNLNVGYKSNTFDELGEDHRSIDVLLRWMMEKSPEGDLSKVLHGAQFICRRGILSRIAIGQQLLDKGNFSIKVERRNGVFFIEEELTEQAKKLIRTMSEAGKRSSYMGYKFENYMLLPPPNKDQTKTNLQMIILGQLRSRYGMEYKLLYSGEVDAIDKDGKYVEMKTQNKGLDGYWFWKEKSLKWWLQSKLVEIDYLIVGIKDAGGFVRQLQKVALDFLKNNLWDGEGCLEFLAETLAFIEAKVPEGSCCRVYCQNGNLFFNHFGTCGRILSEDFKNHFKIK